MAGGKPGLTRSNDAKPDQHPTATKWNARGDKSLLLAPRKFLLADHHTGLRARPSSQFESALANFGRLVTALAHEPCMSSQNKNLSKESCSLMLTGGNSCRIA